MLGTPKTCPHGGTIPKKAKGLSKPTKTVSAKRSNLVSIFCKGVHDTYELLKFLDQIHLQIGDTIAFQRYDDYTGLYHLVIHGQEISYQPSDRPTTLY